MCRRIYPEHRTFVVVHVDASVMVFPEVHIREHLPGVVPKLLHVRVRQQRRNPRDGGEVDAQLLDGLP